MNQPCFGKDYKEDGIFCRVCPDIEQCKEAYTVIINTQGSPNTDAGNPMFEAHVQETPAIKFPNGGAPFTPEVAAKLVKKKAAPSPDDGTTKRGPYGRLQIPFAAGSAQYVRAYYWCKKLGKTYPEIKEQFESGTIGEKGPITSSQQPKPTAAPVKPQEPPKGPDTPKPKTSDEMTLEIFKELTSVIKNSATLLDTVNTNIIAMNNNLLSIRKELENMRSDIKRYGGKH